MLDKMLKSPSVWEKLKGADLPIVCYGTGNGADKIFDEFERLGIKISAVMASDGFVRDRSFRGFKVKSLSDCENEFSDFYCVICFGSQLTPAFPAQRRPSRDLRPLSPRWKIPPAAPSGTA